MDSPAEPAKRVPEDGSGLVGQALKTGLSGTVQVSETAGRS
jgi:hypothetical protein